MTVTRKEEQDKEHKNAKKQRVKVTYEIDVKPLGIVKKKVIKGPKLAPLKILKKEEIESPKLKITKPKKAKEEDEE